MIMRLQRCICKRMLSGWRYALFPAKERLLNLRFDLSSDSSVESMCVGKADFRIIEVCQRNLTIPTKSRVVDYHVEHDVAICVYNVNVKALFPVVATNIELEHVSHLAVNVLI